MFSTIATSGANVALPFSVTRLLAGLTFSLGLILVIVGGAELFTGNNLMVMVTIGNMLGGVTYWFIYLRKRGAK